eukprot:gene8885-biopygen8022
MAAGICEHRGGGSTLALLPTCIRPHRRQSGVPTAPADPGPDAASCGGPRDVREEGIPKRTLRYCPQRRTRQCFPRRGDAAYIIDGVRNGRGAAPPQFKSQWGGRPIVT